MKAYVNIVAKHEFGLSEAVLVCRGGGNGAFASLHRVKQAEDGIPYLTPGEALFSRIPLLIQDRGAPTC
jgi:hypothetical protein